MTEENKVLEFEESVYTSKDEDALLSLVLINKF
jgi:hypothetical protein